MWRCRGRDLDLSRAVVMGVVNVTPDSFSDGGLHLEPAAAIARGRELVAAGAAVIDLGAESTRPGAAPVAAADQIGRLGPVVESLVGDGVCVSVDTASAAVARHALAAGAAIVNDVSALGDPAMADVVAAAGAGLVLMHMQGRPDTMQQAPRYEDAAREVAEFLRERLAAAERAGIAAEQVVLDPGIGFGKRLEDNLELLARLDEIARLGRPVLIGASRKSFLGRLLDESEPAPERRLEGGLAAAAIAVFQGARVIRTHDVAETVRAIRVAEAIAGRRRG